MKPFLPQNKKKIIYITLSVFFMIAVLLVMGMIFYFSAETGAESTKTSNGVTAFLLRLFRPDYDGLSGAEKRALLTRFSFFIRKAAHFTEYFLLGLFSSLFISTVLYHAVRKKDIYYGIPLLFCLLYALFDETHQVFVGGRAGQIGDVVIDFCGSVIAVLAVRILFGLYHRKKIGSSKKLRLLC